MNNYLIFAGTTEGREIVQFLISQSNTSVVACTATEYGKVLLPSSPTLTVISKRLEKEDMVRLMRQYHFSAVIDTTHPYAVVVSHNIKEAAKESKLSYLRVIRPEETIARSKKVMYVDSMEEAVSFLSTTTGNILSTTGSKELSKLCNLPDYETRVYARVLSNPDMVKQSYELGFRGSHLICMQGPFSEELNSALIHQFDISYLLTKSSGKLGGFLEKVTSAAATGITLVVIGRPTVEEGLSVNEVIELISSTI